MNLSIQQLETIADVLMNVLERDVAMNVINIMNQTDDGAFILRRMVRDNIGGVADLIADTIWRNL
mgnify:CR=1 FL=1